MSLLFATMMSRGKVYTQTVASFCWLCNPQENLPERLKKYQESTSKGKIRLVVWNMAFIFPYIGNHNPNWLSYFSEGLKPPREWLTCVSFTESQHSHTCLQWITKARISKMMFKTMMARVYGEHKTTICVAWKWKSHRNRCWSVDRPWLGLIHSCFIYIYIWLSWSRLNMAMSKIILQDEYMYIYIINYIYNDIIRYKYVYIYIQYIKNIYVCCKLHSISSKKQEIFVHHDLAGTSLWLDAEKLDLFWSELWLAYIYLVKVVKRVLAHVFSPCFCPAGLWNMYITTFTLLLLDVCTTYILRMFVAIFLCRKPCYKLVYMSRVPLEGHIVEKNTWSFRSPFSKQINDLSK